MLGSTITRGVGVEYFWGRYIVSRGIEGLSVVTNRIERKDYRNSLPVNCQGTATPRKTSI